MRALHSHHILPLFVWIDDALASSIHRSARGREASLRFMDATMLPVCKLVRRKRHQVARGIAHTGHNWQGEHYGFKLHASIDNDGKLCAVAFSSANIHDSRAIPVLVNEHTKIAVGDTGYRSAPLHKKVRRAFGTFILTPPHYKQQKQLMTESQRKLLRRRPKIEAVFDYLKEHLHLQTSFPRSVQGYALHYTRILLGYQMLRLGWRDSVMSRDPVTSLLTINHHRKITLKQPLAVFAPLCHSWIQILTVNMKTTHQMMSRFSWLRIRNDYRTLIISSIRPSRHHLQKLSVISFLANAASTRQPCQATS